MSESYIKSQIFESILIWTKIWTSKRTHYKSVGIKKPTFTYDMHHYTMNSSSGRFDLFLPKRNLQLCKLGNRRNRKKIQSAFRKVF